MHLNRTYAKLHEVFGVIAGSGNTEPPCVVGNWLMVFKGLVVFGCIALAAGLSYGSFGGDRSIGELGFAEPAVVATLEWADGVIESLRAGISADESQVDPVAAAALDAALTRGLAAPSETPVEAADVADTACAGAGSSEDGIVISDSIAVRIFEYDSSADGPNATHFERLDLSAVYEVDPTGALSIPLIGRVAVEGSSLVCVEALVGDLYRATFGVEASVSASHAGRPAVLVAGAVRAPGSYPLSAATSLRHVAAMAGAGTATMWQDPARAALLGRRTELQRLRADLELRDRALAAARIGRIGLDFSLDDLHGLADMLGASRIDAELAGLRARDEVNAHEEVDRRSRIETATSRLALMESERLRLDRQLAERRERLGKLRGLADRGIAPLSSLVADEAALISLERAAFDLTVERAEAEAELGVAERALAALAMERAEAIAAEGEAIAEAIGGIDAQIASVDIQLAALEGDPGADASGALHFRITRRTSAGERSFEGGLGATIRPGDLIEVTLGSKQFTELR